MIKCNIINNLYEVYDKYDAFIVDIWGVLWDGLEAYDYARDTLEELRKNKKNIVLLSNAPRRSSLVSERLGSIGINKNHYDAIISSGEVCREYFLDNSLNLKKVGNFFYFIGQEADKGITLNLKVKEKENIHESNFLLVCGTRDFGHTLKDYLKELDQGLKLSLPLVCANPDKVVVRKDGNLIVCAGILADYYQNNGGKVFYFGKPYKEVYKKCLAFLNKINPAISNKDVLVIGDSLETDILGANKAAIKSLLIANGIHSKQLYKNSAASLSLKNLKNLSQEFSAFPDYLIKSFIF
ncbi:TIGR01459 family HAD-type hydrolase [Pelagibacteraceae bacterium]|nr:TIGR01459 family HAD-type hydrolase [Pelagibacteraceae bacterium]